MLGFSLWQPGACRFCWNFARENTILAKVVKSKEPRTHNPEAVKAIAAARARLADTPTRPVVHNSGNQKRSPALEEAFLEGLRGGWSVSKSAWAAGVVEGTVRYWRNQSRITLQEDGTYTDDFCVRWDEAWDAGVEKLEDEATRRALHGVEKPVYQGGVLVGTTTEYSDTLLTFALRGKKPDRYNTERHELTGRNGAPIASKMEIEFVESKVKK